MKWFTFIQSCVKQIPANNLFCVNFFAIFFYEFEISIDFSVLNFHIDAFKILALFEKSKGNRARNG